MGYSVDSETIKAYMKLLRHGKPVGVREAQRILEYSSPGKAQRVLEKLVKRGLATRRDDGDYEIIKKLPPFLASYIAIRGIILPRMMIYTAFTSTLVATYILLSKPPLSTILILVLATIPYWIETLIDLRDLRKIWS